MATKRKTWPVLDTIKADLARVPELAKRPRVRKQIMAEVERFYLAQDMQGFRFRMANKVHTEATAALEEMGATAGALAESVKGYRAGTRIAAWAPCRDRVVMALDNLGEYVHAERNHNAGRIVKHRPHNHAIDDLVDRVADVLADAGLRPSTTPTNILTSTLTVILPRKGIGISDVRGRVRSWHRRNSE